MLGGAIKKATDDEPIYVRHSEEVVAGENGIVPKPKDHLTHVEMTPKALSGYPIRVINLTQGVRTQITSGSIDGTKAIKFKNPAALGDNEVSSAKGDHIRLFWVEEVKAAAADTAIEVTISPDTFPGSYRVIGDTFMRSEKTGKDEAFQFIINKAKRNLAA